MFSVSYANKKLWISSRLIEIRFDCGTLSENLGIDIKNKARKTIRQVMFTLIPLQWNSSETGQ